MKAEGEGEWNARKHGGQKRRLWCKIHIGIDEETLEICAIKVTNSGIGDAPMLPDLLNQIPADHDLGSVTADGAYDMRKCHGVIATRNAHAVIPPRKNAKMWKPPSRACRHALTGSGHTGSASTQRSSPILKVSGSRNVATADRVPPQKPRRNEDAVFALTNQQSTRLEVFPWLGSSAFLQARLAH